MTELKGFDPKATYSAAATDYEIASGKYWQFLSARTVEKLALRPGQQVLDVACGTGPATIAAAETVGPNGSVIAADYADGMVDVVKAKVEERGLKNVEVIQGDMLTLPYAADFDAVVCVLGIFFIEDMSAAARALWSYVRPGGQLAITTLGPDVFSPMVGRFIEAARAVQPDIEVVLPWQRTADPEFLASVLARGGVPEAAVQTESDELPMPPEDWWRIVMGSGLRRIATDLGDLAPKVREDNERWLAQDGVTSIIIDANYALATKR
jgi:ubiquinone/menaquinone biosynthesis C-methylase UbiE